MVGEINFGILDPSTPAKVAGSFQQGQANRLAMEQAQQDRDMNALAMQAKKQQFADESALRDIYKQSGGDVGKVVSGMKQAGMYEPAMKLESQLAAQQAAQKKAHIEDALQKMEVLGRVTSGVRDQDSYNMARQQLAQIYGPEMASSIPDVYDPSAVQRFQTQALGIKDQLEQQWKALDFGMKQQQFGFDQSKFSQQQALERAKMGQAERHFQATQGLEREKMQAGKAGGAASEDERKAAGWLAQADNAYKNMLAAMAESKGAERPGLPESLAPEAIKGAFQSPARQKFVQATSSLSESLLRAATGAGQNKDEAAQKVKELTPTYFDSPEVRKQKLDAIPMYLESLKSRAGRAAPKDYAVPKPMSDIHAQADAIINGGR